MLTLFTNIEEFKPETVVIDPISNLITIGNIHEVRSLLIRLMDTLKSRNITGLFTSLTQQNINAANELTEESVSSLIDTWIKLRNEESDGNRTRKIYVLKARGMGHSNEVRQFTISKNGIEIYENQADNGNLNSTSHDISGNVSNIGRGKNHGAGNKRRSIA